MGILKNNPAMWLFTHAADVKSNDVNMYSVGEALKEPSYEPDPLGPGKIK